MLDPNQEPEKSSDAPLTESVVALEARLNPEERRELMEAESQISAGLDTFYDVAKALYAIRNGKLYREAYPSFEAYCREKWDIGRRYANRLIQAGEVLSSLGPIDPKPANEAQARELGRSARELQSVVMQIAVKTAPLGTDEKPMLSAGHIRAVGDTLTAIMLEGNLDDGSGSPKPIGTLLDAAITEEVYERLMRQKTYIREKAEGKKNGGSQDSANGPQSPPPASGAQTATSTRPGASSGETGGKPSQPATTGSPSATGEGQKEKTSDHRQVEACLRRLLLGVDVAMKDRGQKLHPAMHEPYHCGRDLLGESTEADLKVYPLILDIGKALDLGSCDCCERAGLSDRREVTITCAFAGRENAKLMKFQICERDLFGIVFLFNVIECQIVDARETEGSAVQQ